MKTGRPKKPKAERRSEFIKVLLTLAEKKALQDAARPTDISAWAREILLSAVTK
jgi:hypothetical protein